MKKIILIICVNVFCAIFSMDNEEELRNVWRCIKSSEKKYPLRRVMTTHGFIASLERDEMYKQMEAIKASLPAGRGDEIIRELKEKKN